MIAVTNGRKTRIFHKRLRRPKILIMKRITSLVSIFVVSFIFVVVSAQAQVMSKPAVQPFVNNTTATTTSTPVTTQRVPVKPIPQGSYKNTSSGSTGSSRSVVVNRIVKRYYMDGTDKTARKDIADLQKNKVGYEEFNALAGTVQKNTDDINLHENRLNYIDKVNDRQDRESWWTFWITMFLLGAAVLTALYLIGRHFGGGQTVANYHSSHYDCPQTGYYREMGSRNPPAQNYQNGVYVPLNVNVNAPPLDIQVDMNPNVRLGRQPNATR